jgi:hemolysin III
VASRATSPTDRTVSTAPRPYPLVLTRCVSTVSLAAISLLHPGWLETLSIAAYLLLGWTILPAIDRLIAAVSLPALVLLAAGGILYTVGVLFYRWHGLVYRRAIWHGFVLTAAACQYFAILNVIAG